MRALLLAAHQNDETLKLLTESKQYVPKNLDSSGSREMGDSFVSVMKKSKARLDRKIDKAQMKAKDTADGDTSPEVLEALIRCDDLNQQAMLESATEESDMHGSDDEKVAHPEVSLSVLSQNKRGNEIIVQENDPNLLGVDQEV